MPRPTKDNVQLHVRAPRPVVEQFREVYPDLINQFVTRALSYAVESREFFDNVFFHDIVVNHKV